MENLQQTLFPAPMAKRTPLKRHVPTMPPDPRFEEPERGGEPKSIGQLMEPIQRIIEHPDRNRLMADFFKRYW